MPIQKRNTSKVQCCRRTTTNGTQQLIFETPAGQRIVLQDGPASILLEDGNGNSVKLEASGVTVSAAGKISLQASIIEVSTGSLTVNAATTKFSGVVRADTVIANSVIANSLINPAGNVW